MSLTRDQQKLADYIENISEDAYCAAWMDKIEYDLWNIMQGGIGAPYGRMTITLDQILMLRLLSSDISGWIVYDMDIDNPHRYVTFEQWLHKQPPI